MLSNYYSYSPSYISIPYSYRFGFCAKQGEERAVSFAIPRYSGKRHERELGINQSVTAAEYWFYDGRLGRRWNVDPVTKPWESSYAAFANNPIINIDPKGDDTLSFKGSNGNSIQFVHDALPKKSFEFGVKFPESNVFNLNGAKLPDAVGYNIEVSAGGSVGTVAGAVKGSWMSFTVFTEGEYSYQPFRYAYGGGQLGTAFTPSKIDGGVTASVSPFVAWWSGNDKNIKPDTWEKGFKHSTLGATIKAELGISLSGTYFSSTPFDENGGGWQGVSLDVGVSAGAGFNASWQHGVTYYKLLERNVTKTRDLGMLRAGLKWAEFATQGRVPGTFLSDGVQDVKQGWKKTKEKAIDWLKKW